jgi:hypothetical protein
MAQSALFFPFDPVPTRLAKWSTELRPEFDDSNAATGNSYSGLYSTDQAIGTDFQGSIAIGGGAAIELEYEDLTCEGVNALYTFWQSLIVLEQARDQSAFRISPVHCLWGLGCFPRTFSLINQLWVIADKSLEFTQIGTGECGGLFKTSISLRSVPEILSYR